MSVPAPMMTGSMGINNQGVSTNPNVVANPGGASYIGGTGGDISNLLGLAGSAYGLYNSIGLMQEGQTAFNQSNPFGGYRPTYGADLLSLMQDPSSVTSLPGYQFQMNQGVQAIDRSAAAPGGTGFGSGAEGAALTQFGQGLASNFYNQQVQTLAGLAGANISPSGMPGAIQAQGGAATGLGSNIVGLGNNLGRAYNTVSGWMSPSVSTGSLDWSGATGAGSTLDTSTGALAASQGADISSGIDAGISSGAASDVGDLSDLFGFSSAGGEAAGGVGTGGALASPGVVGSLAAPSAAAGTEVGGTVAAGDTAAAGAGTASGAEVGALGAAGFAAAGIGMLVGTNMLFNKQSQISPASEAAMNKNNAAGLIAASQEPYNAQYASEDQNAAAAMIALSQWDLDPANAAAIMNGGIYTGLPMGGNPKPNRYAVQV
jgi:hypothetical protein